MEYSNLDFLEEKAKELRQRLEGDFEDLDMTEMMNELGVDIKDLEEKMLNHRTKLPLQFNKLHPDAVTPKYNYDGDSGFDLHSIDEIVIPPFGRTLVPTGLSFDIKDGYEIQVRTKSGLAINQGLMILNSPGTVDSSYTGEIKGIIFNTNPFEFTIPKGMKIGQAVLCPVVNGGWVDLIEVNKINEKDRGENGFGSTGI
jgi:dUTP pyrophosphatase